MTVDEGLKCLRQAFKGGAFKGNQGQFCALSLVLTPLAIGRFRLLCGMTGPTAQGKKWLKQSSLKIQN